MPQNGIRAYLSIFYFILPYLSPNEHFQNVQVKIFVILSTYASFGICPPA